MLNLNSLEVWFADRCGCGWAEWWPLHRWGFAREYPGGTDPTSWPGGVEFSNGGAARRQVRGLTTPVGGTEEEAQMEWHRWCGSKYNDEEAGKWFVTDIVTLYNNSVIQTGNFCGITWKFNFRILKMIDFYSTFGYFWNLLDEMPESAEVARNTFLVPWWCLVLLPWFHRHFISSSRATPIVMSRSMPWTKGTKLGF